MLSRQAARLLAEPPLNAPLRRIFAGNTSTRPASHLRKSFDLDKDPTTKLLSRTEIVSEKLCGNCAVH
jgi:hypothetical protein